MDMSASDLFEHLDEQLAFIDSSCLGYDDGRHSEAKRLATHVRVLIHDTKMSTGLLTHMGIKESLRFYDAVPHEALETALRPDARVSMPMLALMDVGETVVGYSPTFQTLGLGDVMMPFDPWWTDPRMFDLVGNTASRKQIVMWLANKDGGAHVDKLPPTYAALSREGSMGVAFSFGSGPSSITFNGEPGERTTASPIPAAMRHIAEEVRTSIRVHLRAK